MQDTLYLQGFRAKINDNLRSSDWLAGDAVLIAPVSKVKSLLTGNYTGKISVSELPQVGSRDVNGCVAVAFSDIPYAN